MKTPKELIKLHFHHEKDMPIDDKFNLESIIEIIQKEAYNQAIDDAVFHALIRSTNNHLKLQFPDGWEESQHTDLISGTKCRVSQESILKLKK